MTCCDELTQHRGHRCPPQDATCERTTRMMQCCILEGRRARSEVSLVYVANGKTDLPCPYIPPYIAPTLPPPSSAALLIRLLSLFIGAALRLCNRSTICTPTLGTVLAIDQQPTRPIVSQHPSICDTVGIAAPLAPALPPTPTPALPSARPSSSCPRASW